jgi:hypothetical protein
MNEPFFYGCWPVDVGVERTIELEYFNRSDSLLLECTQLGGKPSRQTKIVKEWCTFFTSNKSEIKNLFVASRLPARLFDAICESRALEQFGFKWGPVKDISRLRNLKSLTHLGLGSCSATDLSPLSSLESCQQLSIENADRVSDYSPLGGLVDLQFLHIDGAPLSTNKRSTIDSIDFVSELKNLRGLSLGHVTILDDRWPKVIARLSQLEELFIPEDTSEGDRGMLLEALPQLENHNLSHDAT